MVFGPNSPTFRIWPARSLPLICIPPSLPPGVVSSILSVASNVFRDTRPVMPAAEIRSMFPAVISWNDTPWLTLSDRRWFVPTSTDTSPR